MAKTYRIWGIFIDSGHPQLDILDNVDRLNEVQIDKTDKDANAFKNIGQERLFPIGYLHGNGKYENRTNNPIRTNWWTKPDKPDKTLAVNTQSPNVGGIGHNG